MTITYSYPAQGYVCPSCNRPSRLHGDGWVISVQRRNERTREQMNPVVYHAGCFTARFSGVLTQEDEVEQDWCHEGKWPEVAVTRPGTVTPL